MRYCSSSNAPAGLLPKSDRRQPTLATDGRWSKMLKIPPEFYTRANTDCARLEVHDVVLSTCCMGVASIWSWLGYNQAKSVVAHVSNSGEIFDIWDHRLSVTSIDVSSTDVCHFLQVDSNVCGAF